MTAWSRRISTGALVLILALGAGCDSGQSPVEPSPSPALAVEPSPLLGGILKELQELRLLSCSTQPYAKTTRTVGPEGGVIVVGTHRLVIPPNALSRTVTITAEQVSGRVNSVRFAPEGLRFDRPAALTLSYANCSPLMILKRVVYTDELLRILELLPSLDNRNNRTVTGAIRHFSRYAVAW
jgi:hypothetical protein